MLEYLSLYADWMDVILSIFTPTACLVKAKHKVFKFIDVQSQHVELHLHMHISNEADWPVAHISDTTLS